jgi:hypothetical protein
MKFLSERLELATILYDVARAKDAAFEITNRKKQ